MLNRMITVIRKNFKNYIVCVIVVIACFVGFSSTAPTQNDEDIDYKFDEPWVTINSREVDLITSTTPDPERAEPLPCEVIHETLNKDISIAFKEEITDLLDTYNDWGKLLAPAPVAIGILGQLILMANQLKDFPINSEDPGKVFKHIKYPNSFRTTLLQISQRGFSAFLLAHRNMDAIRFHNSVVPSDIKDAFRYIMSNNTKLIELRLPPTIMKISEVAKKSQNLSKEVVDEFKSVLDLIVETQGAINSTKIGAHKRLDQAILDIQVEAKSKKLSERENLILKQKDAKMKNMLKRLEIWKGKLYHTSVYKRSKFTINLANNWVEEMGQDRYNKDNEFLHKEGKKWVHSYQDNFVDSNPCAQRNSQHLLDLLIAFKEYRQRYEHWQTLGKRDKLPFNGTEVIRNIERIFGNLQNCSDIESITTKGDTLMVKLKSPSTFKSLNKNSTRPGNVEIKELVALVSRLRISSNNVHEKAGKKSRIVTNSGWNLFNASKHHQLDQLSGMSKTVKEIVKLNTELMEIRKEKTKQILGRIANLEITKGNIEYVVRVLKEGLVELGKLKNDWEMLIQFFDKIRIFIERASRHSDGLISILNHFTSDYPNGNVSQPFDIYDDLLDSVEKSNEAAFLVYGIADMYVNVSTLYIMDRINRLNTLNSMRITGATKEQLKLENEILTKNATDASNGIENYIRKHENQLSEELNKRHLKIFNEYQQFANCLKNKEILPEENKWFQIKSRLNDKVLEVSPEFNSQGYPVIQIWDALSIDNHQQMWYLSENKTIQSVSNDFCLTSPDEYNASVTVEPCDNTEGKQWTIKDNSIINLNNPTDCLNILDDPEENGALVVLDKCPSESGLQNFSVVFSEPTDDNMMSIYDNNDSSDHDNKQDDIDYDNY